MNGIVVVGLVLSLSSSAVMCLGRMSLGACGGSAVLREGEVAEIKRLEGHLVDALAPRGDEGRGTLR